MHTSSSQKNKQLIKSAQSYIAILFVASISVYSFFYAPPRAETVDTPRTHTVFMNRDTFDPPLIRVAEGDRVRFVNQDEMPHWPASDPHPTHEFLDIFDAREEIPPQGSKEFIFPNPGEWRYHDHLSPHRKGMVMVVPSKNKSLTYPDFRPVLSQVTTWLSSAVPRSAANDSYASPQEMDELMREKDTRKQAKIVRDMAEKYGPSETLRFMVKSTLPRTGETHLLVHEIGDVAYERYGRDALKYCDESFLSACFHGVLLNALGDNGMQGVADMITKCKEKDIHVFTQCAHAAGHGFLAWKSYRVLDALPLCDALGQINTDMPLFNCYDGIFMENIFGVHEGKPSPNRMIKKGDPYYPCNAIPEKYQGGCWANQATLLYQLFEGDLRKVAAQCDRMDNQEYQRICYHNFARQIHPMTEGKLNPAISLCKNATEAWQDECLVTLVSAAFSVGDRSELPYGICAYLKQAQSPLEQKCVDELFGLIASYAKTHDEKTEWCGLVEGNARQNECARLFGVHALWPKKNQTASKNELEELAGIIASAGVRTAYAEIKRRYTAAPIAAHDLAHMLGRAAYDELGIDAFQVCDNHFAFGCFHGLLDELIRQKGDASLDVAKKGCKKLFLSGAIASCMHGIGHGIYSWRGGIAPSLKTCNALSEQEKIFCFDGAFMEHFTGVMQSNKNAALGYLEDTVWNFCLDFNSDFQAQCVRNHTLFLAYAHPQKSALIARLCAQLTPRLREQCVNSMGLFASQISQGSSKIPLSICGAFSDENDHTSCIAAAATEFIFQGTPEETALSLCGNAPAIAKNQCITAIARTQSLYGKK